MDRSPKEVYAQMSDDELMHLATQKDSLLDAGRQALEVEMQKRGMSEEAVLAYKSQGQQEKQKRRFKVLGDGSVFSS